LLCDRIEQKVRGINPLFLRLPDHIEKEVEFRIRNIMSSQTVVTTRMKLENKDCIVLRNVTHPNMEQKKMYSALKFKQTNPKMRKKAVVPHK